MGARVYASLVIIVSAQVLRVLTLGLWALDFGLTISDKCLYQLLIHKFNNVVSLSYFSQFSGWGKLLLITR